MTWFNGAWSTWKQAQPAGSFDGSHIVPSSVYEPCHWSIVIVVKLFWWKNWYSPGKRSLQQGLVVPPEGAEGSLPFLQGTSEPVHHCCHHLATIALRTSPSVFTILLMLVPFALFTNTCNVYEYLQCPWILAVFTILMLVPFAMFSNTCNVYQIKAGTLLLVREQEVESVISWPWMFKRLLRAKICNGHLWKGSISSDHRTEIIARKVKGLYIWHDPQSPPPFVAQAGEGRDKGWDGDQAHWAHLAKKNQQK